MVSTGRMALAGFCSWILQSAATLYTLEFHSVMGRLIPDKNDLNSDYSFLGTSFSQCYMLKNISVDMVYQNSLS